MTDHKLPARCGETGVTLGDDRLVEAPVGRTGPTGVGREWTVDLPYVEPPLTANQRLHRMRRASITADIREDTTRPTGLDAAHGCGWSSPNWRSALMCSKCQPERTGKRGWLLVVLIVAMVVWCAVRFTGGWPW